MLAPFFVGVAVVTCGVIDVVAEWSDTLPRGNRGDRVKGALAFILLATMALAPQPLRTGLDWYDRWKVNAFREQIEDLLPVRTPPESDLVTIP